MYEVASRDDKSDYSAICLLETLTQTPLATSRKATSELVTRSVRPRDNDGNEEDDRREEPFSPDSSPARLHSAFPISTTVVAHELGKLIWIHAAVQIALLAERRALARIFWYICQDTYIPALSSDTFASVSVDLLAPAPTPS